MIAIHCSITLVQLVSSDHTMHGVTIVSGTASYIARFSLNTVYALWLTVFNCKNRCIMYVHVVIKNKVIHNHQKGITEIFHYGLLTYGRQML